MVSWDGADGLKHWCSKEDAIKQLKSLYDEWPGGLDEVRLTFQNYETAIALQQVSFEQRLVEQCRLLENASAKYARYYDQLDREPPVRPKTSPLRDWFDAFFRNLRGF